MLAVPRVAQKIRVVKISSSVATKVAPRIWQETVGPNSIRQVIRDQKTGKGGPRDRKRRGREREVKRRCRGEDRMAPVTKEREGNQAICTTFGGGASLKGIVLSHLCKLCLGWHLGMQGSCGRGLRGKFLSRAASSYVWSCLYMYLDFGTRGWLFGKRGAGGRRLARGQE